MYLQVLNWSEGGGNQRPVERENSSTDPEKQYVGHPADRYTFIRRDYDSGGTVGFDETHYCLKHATSNKVSVKCQSSILYHVTACPIHCLDSEATSS